MTRRRGPIGRAGGGLTVLATAFAGLVWFGGVAGAALPEASSSRRSLDICVVLPGFAIPGDATFQIETTGPTVRGKQFKRTSTFDASACLTLRKLPPGTFTMTQIVSPPEWALAAVYCFNTGHAAHPTNKFDPATSSARVKVKKTTECMFAELALEFAPPPSAPSGGGTQTTTPAPRDTAPPDTAPPDTTPSDLPDTTPIDLPLNTRP